MDIGTGSGTRSPRDILSGDGDILDNPDTGESGVVPNSVGGIPLIDPATDNDNSGRSSGIGGTDAGNSGTGKRGRGRPPGSGNGRSSNRDARRPTAQETKSSIVGIEKILHSIHLVLAKATKVQELELDPKEAEVLAASLSNVAAHYSIAVDPKITAWIGLIGVAGSIYGPRVAAYGMRKKMEGGKEKQQPQKQEAEFVPQGRPDGNVMPFVMDASAFGKS